MEFIIRRADISDAKTMAELGRRAFEEMPVKEWYVMDSEAYFREMLSEGRGSGYLALEKDSREPAGMLLITFPGDSGENLGNDIGFSREKRLRTAHMESAAVLSGYRGNQLQYRLMQTGEKELKERGFTYLMCTVHPENRYSKSNILRQGYQVVLTKEKYGGHLRDILLKELSATKQEETV